MKYGMEERAEHGRKTNENRPQMELRHPGAHHVHDSPNDIRRGGGSDHRRYEAQIIIDRKIRDHDMSGYNHNATSTQPANGGHENEMYENEQDVKAVRMGTPNPDGTYTY
jgi:hypothetical protein